MNLPAIPEDKVSICMDVLTPRGDRLSAGKLRLGKEGHCGHDAAERIRQEWRQEAVFASRMMAGPISYPFHLLRTTTNLPLGSHLHVRLALECS